MRRCRSGVRGEDEYREGAQRAGREGRPQRVNRRDEAEQKRDEEAAGYLKSDGSFCWDRHRVSAR